jgi:hypothetical protein
VGFDDIHSAAFQNPSLTTVRRPLRQMGVIAAETLLERINSPREGNYQKEIVVEPELIVRGTTMSECEKTWVSRPKSARNETCALGFPCDPPKWLLNLLCGFFAPRLQRLRSFFTPFNRISPWPGSHSCLLMEAR